jgi:hydroxymethylpyrimidine pyrophosphatase-like HAD family hydrolase
MTHIAAVFDVDNTLTPPRRPLRADMAAALGQLRVPFVLAAGSNLDIVHDQFLTPLHGFGFRGSFDAYLCNGATRYHCECESELKIRVVDDFNIKECLGPKALRTVLGVLEQSLGRPEFQLSANLSVIGDRIIDRKSMLNLAPIGRPQGGTLADKAQKNRDAFVEFDAQTGYRRRYLTFLRAELAPISAEKDLVVTYGGQTSFDLVIRGRDKTFPIRTLLGAGCEEVVYFGDALFDGGNDAAVLDMIKEWSNGPCPVKAERVDSCEETLGRLHALGFLRT